VFTEPILECARLYFNSLEVCISHVPNRREIFVFNFIRLQETSENGVNLDYKYIEIFPYNGVKTADQSVNGKESKG
jgi:hypothetical protein